MPLRGATAGRTVVAPVADQGASRSAAETERAAADRLAFFSDAVVAIAITVLVLGLPVPTGVTNADLLHSAREHSDDYIAFAVSFVVISAHWRGHHGIYRYLIAAPPSLIRWNFLWLMMIVITPFATRLLTESGGFQVRFTFYALVQALTAGFLLLAVREMVRKRLRDPNAPPDLVPDAVAGLGSLSFSFLVSIPVAFATRWAFAIWAAGPLLQRVVWRRRPRDRPK
jgi:uncharacterized membrane protein